MVDIPNHTDDVLRITSARACLPLPRPAVWGAVQDLISHLWTSHIVLAEPTELLIHSVSANQSHGPDGWLTWSLDALSAENTVVTVSFSEQHDSAPAPELDLLLCRLVAEAIGTRSTPSSDTSLSTRHAQKEN